MLNDWTKQILLWAVILVILVSVFHSLSGGVRGGVDLPYSEFLREVRSDNIQSVEISADGGTIVGKRKGGGEFVTNAPLDFKLIDDLVAHRVEVVQKPKPRDNILVTILVNALPILLFLGVFIYFMRQMQSGGGGKGAMSFGRSRARLQGEDQVKITFADVAGVDEAKDEVQELVEFLRRLMVKLGVSQEQSKAVAAAPATVRTPAARMATVDNRPVVQLDEGFDRAWRRVGRVLPTVRVAAGAIRHGAAGLSDAARVCRGVGRPDRRIVCLARSGAASAEDCGDVLPSAVRRAGTE